MKRTAARVWRSTTEARREFGRSGNVLTSVVVLPGLLSRVGLRWAIGRLVGTRVRHVELSYEFGGVLTTEPAAHGGRLAVLIIAPSVVLVALGLALALPIVLEVLFLGVDIAPDQLSAEGARRLVIERYVVRGTEEGLRLWCALSVWYAAALSLEEVRAATSATRNSHWPKVVRGAALTVLAPVRLVSRITDPLDRYLRFASGAVSVIAWGFSTLLVARLLAS